MTLKRLMDKMNRWLAQQGLNNRGYADTQVTGSRNLQAQIKRVALTIAGVALILCGIVLVVLPGPALLFIPLGMALLAIEYPSVRPWLRKLQNALTQAARKADLYWANRKRSKRQKAL